MSFFSFKNNMDVTGTITCDTSITVGANAFTEAEVGELGGTTAGVAVAEKALIVDSAKNIATIGTIGCGAITSTGNSSMGQLTTASRIIIDDTTEATTTTDGSLQTDGGLSVAKDILGGNDLIMLSDSAVMHFGASKEITLTHIADTGLNLKHTATGDDKPIILTLQTGETVIEANDVLGAINFQAPNESSGSDSILVAASIEVVAETEFGIAANPTQLIFKTGASGATSETMSLSSAGNVIVTGTIACATSLSVSGSTLSTTTIGYLDIAAIGEVTASKALIVDANKDLGTNSNFIRNLTIDGTFSDGNYTFDTSGNVSGLGTVGCGVITSTGASTFGGLLPTTPDGATIGTAASEWSDLYLANGGNVYFGDGQEVKLEHMPATGLKLTGFLVHALNTITVGSASTISSTSPIAGTVSNPTGTLVYLQVEAGTDDEYFWDLRSFNPPIGTVLHLIYDEQLDTHPDMKLTVTFTTSKLFSATGPNTSMTFNTTGESSSIVYIASTIWFIINTGALVA
jgi:hypothetical protein